MFTIIGWGVLQLAVFVVMLWCFLMVWYGQQWSSIWRLEDTILTLLGVLMIYVNYVVWEAAPFTVMVTTTATG